MPGLRLTPVARRSWDRGVRAVVVVALTLLPALYFPALSVGQAPKRKADHNWAGYAVTGPSPFQQVRGAWTQPSLTCGMQRTYSAFWVGLGGFKKRSRLLEQVGTTASCINGNPEVQAFYEIWPERGGELTLDARAGDQLVASVSVRGRRVSLRLDDLTIHQVRTKVILMREPDTSSAEWIAEAPARICGGNCLSLLPLADFGEVAFSEAGAASQGGGMKAISGPSFFVNRLTLRDNNGLVIRKPRLPLAHGSKGEAAAGPLSPAGTSFGVTWLR